MAPRKPKAATLETTNEQGPLDLITAAPNAVAVLDLSKIKPEEYVAEIYRPFNAKLAVLKAESDTIFFSAAAVAALPDEQRAVAKLIDISTTGGMDTAIKYRAAFRDDVRLASDKERKARKAPLLSIGRLLESQCDDIADAVKPYEAKYHTAINAEVERKAAEKAEAERINAARIAAIKAKIEDLRGAPAQLAAVNPKAADIRAVLANLAHVVITETEMEEFTDEANLALEVSGQEMMRMLLAAEAAEKAEAERVAAVARENARLAAVAEANRKETERLEKLRIEHELAEAESKRRAAAEEKRIADARATLEADMAEFARMKAAAEAPPVVECEVVAEPEPEAEPVDTVTGDLFALAPEVEVAPDPAPEPAPAPAVRVVAAEPEPVAEMVPTDIEIAAIGAHYGLTPVEWADRLEMFVTASRAGFLEAA